MSCYGPLGVLTLAGERVRLSGSVLVVRPIEDGGEEAARSQQERKKENADETAEL
jgi:hypothetical protein